MACASEPGREAGNRRGYFRITDHGRGVLGLHLNSMRSAVPSSIPDNFTP